MAISLGIYPIFRQTHIFKHSKKDCPVFYWDRNSPKSRSPFIQKHGRIWQDWRSLFQIPHESMGVELTSTLDDRCGQTRFSHDFPIEGRSHVSVLDANRLDPLISCLHVGSNWKFHKGLSENRLNPYTQWFCWSLSLLNGYFIGGLPHFQTYP